MRKVLIIMILILTTILNANEKRDFRFIEELYQRDELEFAKMQLEDFIKKYPQSELKSKAEYYTAMIELLENKFSQAEEKLLMISKASADSDIRPLVIVALIQANYFQEDYVDANKYANEFIASFPANTSITEVYYWLGRIALDNGEYIKADSYLTQIGQENSSSMTKYLEFQLRIKQDDIDTAEKVLSETYSKYQDEYVNQIVLEWYNYLYENLDYKKIVSSNNYKVPKHSRLYSDYAIILGQAYYKTGDFESAKSVFNSISPDTDVKRFYLGLAYKATGDLKIASGLFRDLSDNSDMKKIKDLSFFELVNYEIKVPVGSEEEKAQTIKSNNLIFARINKFIERNPDSKYIGNAYYLTSYIKYLEADYKQSLDLILMAKNQVLDNDTSEKLLFLVSDIYFIDKEYKKAISFLTNYIDLYPNGRFYDEVLYKMGLSYFNLGEYKESAESLTELAKKYPDFVNISTTYFYLGEINTINENYEVALEYFEMCMTDSVDKNAVWLRISELNFLLSKWEETIVSLQNIDTHPLYLFRANLIKGNVFYNLNNYEKALEYYTISYDNAIEAKQIDQVNSRMGWTYYLMKDFEKAESKFRELSKDSNSSEDYLILAGSSAMNGKNYADAVNLFREFTLKYPESYKLNYVNLNLADSYFNQNQFEDALNTYIKVLDSNPSKSEFKNSILGIKWSVLSDKNKDYRSKLATLARKMTNKNVSRTLKQIILLYESQEEKWEDLIKTGEELIKENPQDRQNKNVSKNLAIAYTKTNQFERADSLYSALTDSHKDAEVFSAWADVFLARKDTTNAKSVLNEGIGYSNEPEIWIKLLKLQLSTKDSTFVSTHKRFVLNADKNFTDYANLLKIEYDLKLNKKVDIILAESLKDSDDDRLSSLSYYLLGLQSYRNQDYNAASLYMMRVLFLFEEYKDLNVKASYYLILSQIENNRFEKAKQSYDSYKSLLPEWQKNELYQRLIK